MSVETGYITQVTPDCLATCMDFDGRDVYVWLQSVAPPLTPGPPQTRFASLRWGGR